MGHPHDMGNYLVQDWSKVWTQELGEGMAYDLWEKIKQLIILSKSHNNEMDKISSEDVKRGIKTMNSGTAVGIDQAVEDKTSSVY